jgi:ferredoxin-NADP reductase
VSGGSGITVMLSFIDYYLYFAEKKRRATENAVVDMKIHLINCSSSTDDCMASEYLARKVRENLGILEVVQLTSRMADTFTLPFPEFKSCFGKITSGLLRDSMPKATDEGRAMIAICGPPNFMEAVETMCLEDLKIPESMIKVIGE